MQLKKPGGDIGIELVVSSCRLISRTGTVLKAYNVRLGVSYQLKIREDMGPGVFCYG